MTPTKATHTPGNWKTIIAQPGTMLEVVNEDREYVCSFLGGEEHKQENARLIAAAPDLLDACKKVVQNISPEFYQEEIEALEAAIDKAESPA